MFCIDLLSRHAEAEAVHGAANFDGVIHRCVYLPSFNCGEEYPYVWLRQGLLRGQSSLLQPASLLDSTGYTLCFTTEGRHPPVSVMQVQLGEETYVHTR